MKTPVITAYDTPQQHECARCGHDTHTDHYLVTTQDGPLCEDCAYDLHDGLGDVAHGLSLIKWALLHEIAQEQRGTVQRYCEELAELAGQLRSGATVVYRQEPDGSLTLERPGGTDPHDTIRRHVIKSV
ncbi:hypothetical protein [Streptacidiphilus sp. PAMC 29251]